MGNPVRPWQNFLTAWQKLDLEGQDKVIYNASKTLIKLRAHRKDIDKRILYWENNLKLARKARREVELLGRGRERHDRLGKSDWDKGS